MLSVDFAIRQLRDKNGDVAILLCNITLH